MRAHTIILLLGAVAAIMSPSVAVTQNYSTTTEYATVVSNSTNLVTISYSTSSVIADADVNPAFSPYPDSDGPCPWIQVQIPSLQVTVAIRVIADAPVDFYIVRKADYYPYGSVCRPFSGNPLVAEKQIQEYSQVWTPPSPGAYYFVWDDSTHTSFFGSNVQFSYSIVTANTLLTTKEIRLTKVTTESPATSEANPTINPILNPVQAIALIIIVTAALVALFWSRNRSKNEDATRVY